MLLVKRICCVLLFFLSICLLSQLRLPATHAQYSPNNIQETNIDVPQNMHTYTQSVFINVLSTITCVLSGSDPMSENHKCLGWDGKTQRIGYVEKNGGLVGVMTQAIILTYNIPVHTGAYTQYLASNFHILGTPSYAANEIGIGATGLDPLLKMWVAFRNTAYLFMVIIFVVVGLLIMLRVKVDPRTVMSIQNQIPKIIIGLLAITFSFAIAGLFIDLMYVLTFFTLNIIQNAVKGVIDITPAQLVTYTEPFGAANSILPKGLFGAADAGNASLGPAVNGLIAQIPVLGWLEGLFQVIFWAIGGIASVLGSIGAVLPALVGVGSGWNPTAPEFASTGLAGLVIWILLLVAILTALFRFWVALISCYITILFNIILGPMRILFGMVPGGPGGGLSGWAKDLIANLLVFPVSISFLFLAAALSKAVSNQQAFTPYLIPGTGIGGLLCFVAILMLPKLPDQVKEWFKVKDGALGQAVGQGLSVGFGVVRSGGTAAGQRLFGRGDPYRGIREGSLYAAAYARFPKVMPKIDQFFGRHRIPSGGLPGHPPEKGH